MLSNLKNSRHNLIRQKINDVLDNMPKELKAELIQKISSKSIEKRVTIIDENKKEVPIEIKLRPWLVDEAKVKYYKKISLLVRGALNRILPLYFSNPDIKKILPLTQDEEAWFGNIYPNGLPEAHAIFERIDTNAIADLQERPDDFKFIEFNSVGIGCIYHAPAANEIARETILPFIKQQLPQLEISNCADYRKLLLESVCAHAKAIGRNRLNTAFVERRETGLGSSDEFEYIARYFKDKGLLAVSADPRQLEINKGEIYYKDMPIDIIYRDYQISELISIEKHGGSAKVIKEAFKRNMVISGLLGEFDHKSICEIFTNAEFNKYLTLAEKFFLRRHFLWTRLIFERKTFSPDGKVTGLYDYIKNNQERLVIKPNRSFGGKDVLIGTTAATSVWLDALNNAFKRPGDFVAQELTQIRAQEFPELAEYGQISSKKCFVTTGVTAAANELTFLCRFSSDKVVNISRGGGIIPIFVVS